MEQGRDSVRLDPEGGGERVENNYRGDSEWHRNQEKGERQRKLRGTWKSPLLRQSPQVLGEKQAAFTACDKT